MNTFVDVIIRTRDCDQTLPPVIDALKSQKNVCLNFYIVDNSSPPIPISFLPEGTIVIPYTLPKFNYSMAINMAIPYLTSEFVLICSSHTVLQNQQTVHYSVTTLKSDNTIAAACFSSKNTTDSSFSCIDFSTFDGRNGAWNTASLHRTNLLRERPFNPDVFSAEDQEWSRWVLSERGMKIAHIEGAGMSNINPRQYDPSKLVKEWVCIAFYSYPPYRTPRFIASRIILSIKCLLKGEVSEAIFWSRVSIALLQLILFPPRGSSSYF
jgi:hypothetical protein